MADIRNPIRLDTDKFVALRKEFAKLRPSISAKYLGAALRVAIKPATKHLRQLTPKGPTGNLKRSIATKVKKYPKSGNAVALTGYQTTRRGGKKGRAYHQGFLEFGTKLRRARGRYASTYFGPTIERAGKFQVITTSRGKNRGRIRTRPFPKSFFKVAKRGERVELGKMPVGGRKKLSPVKTSWVRSQSEVRATLRAQMTEKLANALRDVAKAAERRGLGRVRA